MNAKRAIELRGAWSAPGHQMAIYAAIITHRKALDPTKGTGKKHLDDIKAAYLHEIRNPPPPPTSPTSRLPTEPPS